MRIGIIGSGQIGTTLAKLIIKSGNEVVLCNSQGIESLKPIIEELGEGAFAGTFEDVTSQDIVILAVWWQKAKEVLEQKTNWDGKILIDVTNQLYQDETGNHIANVEPLTGSEVIASYAKGAKVIKAFNSLFGQYMDGETEEGNRVLFYAGDNEDDKKILHSLFENMGFYPVNLGSLAVGGRLMQVGGALNGKHFIKRKEDMCI